jgi:hypothetical protein
MACLRSSIRKRCHTTKSLPPKIIAKKKTKTDSKPEPEESKCLNSENIKDSSETPKENIETKEDPVTTSDGQQKCIDLQKTQDIVTSESMNVSNPDCVGTDVILNDTPIIVAPTSEIAPSFENLMTYLGKLAWPHDEVKDFAIGQFDITGVISNSGSHGLVLSCMDHNKTHLAMKIERKCGSMSVDNEAFQEISTHKFNQQQQDLYIPRLVCSFVQNGKEITVMEKLGPDLFTLLHATQSGKGLSKKSTMQIALSLITAYEQIHKSGWLHMTTKPINFCIGGTSKTRQKVYAVDFGRAQKYIIEEFWTGEQIHRPNTGEQKQIVHLEFSSILCDEHTPSRRDDMISLILMIMYMERSLSPWQSQGIRKSTWFNNLKSKDNVSCFWELFIYWALQLEYDQEPHYEIWRRTIRAEAASREIELDGTFEWDDKLRVDENGSIVLINDL